MYEIIGVREVKGSNKAGQPYSGVQIYATFSDKYILGVGSERFYFSSSLLPSMYDFFKVKDFSGLVGKQFSDVLYNKWGKVCGVR